MVRGFINPVCCTSNVMNQFSVFIFNCIVQIRRNHQVTLLLRFVVTLHVCCNAVLNIFQERAVKLIIGFPILYHCICIEDMRLE